MEYLVTRKEMQAYDTYTIESIGIPSMVLMERAALKTVDVILNTAKNMGFLTGSFFKQFYKDVQIAVVCGTGNNGGDGLCVARLLLEQGIYADTFLVGDREKLSVETKKQLEILDKYNFAVSDTLSDKQYDIVVDALFGNGLTREIAGEYQKAIEWMNQNKAYKIAIDIPSGIDADTGKVLGCAVSADETVAIAFRKRGHVLFPGTTYCGDVKVADIGITPHSFHGQIPQMYTYTEQIQQLLPERKPDGNKGTFGKVLLIAGSTDMAGAAVLCAESIYKTGAGMVKLVIPEAIREIIQTRIAEALIQVYTSADGLTDAEETTLEENLRWADVVAIGPGLGLSQSAKALLEKILTTDKPLVADADALNLLAMDENKVLWEVLTARAQPTILTPHMAELARLSGVSTKEVVEDETKATQNLAKKSHCIVVGKSARTHVCGAGERMYLNSNGNDKMASAASGDVLTGVITAVLAQGIEAWDAACLGVYIHAGAGDKAVKGFSCLGLKALDIIGDIDFVI